MTPEHVAVRSSRLPNLLPGPTLSRSPCWNQLSRLKRHWCVCGSCTEREREGGGRERVYITHKKKIKRKGGCPTVAAGERRDGVCATNVWCLNFAKGLGCWSS